jgi:hypothetical protein
MTSTIMNLGVGATLHCDLSEVHLDLEVALCRGTTTFHQHYPSEVLTIAPHQAGNKQTIDE